MECGDRVAAILRKIHVLDDLKTKYGDRLWVAALDVRDTSAVRKVVDHAFSDLGQIDIIVNNAALTDRLIALEAQKDIAQSINV